MRGKMVPTSGSQNFPNPIKIEMTQIYVLSYLCSFFASKSQPMIFLVFWLHVHRNGQKGRNSFVLNLVFTNVIEALLLLFTVSVKNHQPKLEREMEVLKKKKKLTPGK